MGVDEHAPLNAYPAAPIQFHTFPDPRLPSGSHFRFVVSSCVTPNFPYVPFHGRRIKGFDLLADYLWPHRPEASTPVPSARAGAEEDTTSPEDLTTEAIHDLTADELKSTPAPEFMLFLGDFIYADVPMYFGDDAEAYRRLYRRNYQSESFRKIYEHLRELPEI